jgi:hypothetical protein
MVDNNLNEPGRQEIQKGCGDSKTEGEQDQVFVGFQIAANPQKRFHNFSLSTFCSLIG